jgi:hypothetical protein
MIIEVRIGNSSPYAYAWGGGEIAVGDKVLLPPAPWHGWDGPPQIGTVSALASSYTGRTTPISLRADG